MINGFSKFAVLYLAPVLMLTALFLSLFAFLAPSVMLHDQVALLTVTPSTALTNPQAQANDGPSLFLGALGSCSRHNNAGAVNCTATSISPQYDTSVLPGATSNDILSAPPSTAPAFIAVAISLSFVFFFAYSLVSFRHKFGEGLSEKLDSPMIQRITAWIGVFGFMIGARIYSMPPIQSAKRLAFQLSGLASFLIVRMWFEKAIDDFNQSIVSQSKNAPELVAAAGNGFTMVWIAYAFYGIPLIASLAKINVHASEGKEY
ncbi:hypothetical protein PILCRDRAFT_354716 [Piloderma croceum F 1598]|uniref:Uncharacterized protein n=1 Tax=Piloderma croceum (strain F 1598) TaxID=765440 RepID=A0A0C3FME0_PILCF|nr:hypothetical protein PILCRDRAFT_354716 [Piloderma croceum F 1598]